MSSTNQSIDMTALAQHPLSAAWPAMQADEYQSLKDSIEVIGVQNPITLFEGMVIDGWHRYTAANELGMDCPSKELDAWIDPVAFVRAQNKDRRHLPLSAWALIEVSLREWKPAHRPGKGALSAPLQASNQEMADAAGVKKRLIQQAKAVQNNATPEVIAAVKSGEIGLPKAAAIAKLPKEEQAAAIHKPAKLTPAQVEKSVARIEADRNKEIRQQIAELQSELTDEPEYTVLDAAHDQITELQAMLAVANMGEVAPEDKDQAKNLIAELQEENRKLRINLKAVTTSRDTLMNELAMVKRQCVSLQTKLKKAA